MSVNGIGEAHQPSWYQAGKAESSGRTDFAMAVKTASGTGNSVTIDKNALFSICHAKTGESANVYRADNYSEDNPVYLVKGIDKNGKEYEQTVDVSKVNPDSCSYTEMLALNAHTGNRSDGNFLTMSILKDKSGSASFFEKAGYLSAAYQLMSDMQTLGNREGYLRYDKWIHDILAVSGSRNKGGNSVIHHRVSKTQMPSGTFELHTSNDKDGKAIGAVCGSDYSLTVYRPHDFDAENPVYKVKVWDKDGNVTERMVDVSKVNPGACDYIDMFAYSSHLSASGQHEGAQSSFTSAAVNQYGPDGRGYSDLFGKTDWFSVLKNAMQAQYDAGNMKGYLEYKKFWDFLNR